jgi:hypothetical protein
VRKFIEIFFILKKGTVMAKNKKTLIAGLGLLSLLAGVFAYAQFQPLV